MLRSRESGKVRFGQLVATAVAVVVGVGAAYWVLTHKKESENALKKAEKAAEQAAGTVGQAVSDDIKKTNDAFDASRARQTEKRTGGLIK